VHLISDSPILYFKLENVAMLSSRRALLVIASLFARSSSLRAERAPLSAEKKDQESTHVVTGDVLGLPAQDPLRNNARESAFA
jgi:hypothetical protein